MYIKIRSIIETDRPHLVNLLSRIKEFDAEDRKIALMVIDTSLYEPERETNYFVIATAEDGKIVGYACYGEAWITDRTFELYWIAVDPDYGNKGVGTLILKGVEKGVADLKGRMIVLETSSSQEYAAARHFYLKNGYTIVSTIKDFYRDGEDKVTFLKNSPIS